LRSVRPESLYFGEEQSLVGHNIPRQIVACTRDADTLTQQRLPPFTVDLAHHPIFDRARLIHFLI
jgi:hypothetical protein